MTLPGFKGAALEPSWWALARRPLYWRFNLPFPYEHAHVVREAFEWWKDQGVPLLPSELAVSSLVVTWTDREPDETHRAWYLPFADLGEILVGPRWAAMQTFGDARRVNLIRHEIGHALGFKHTGNVLSLMHPKVANWPMRIGLLPGERAELRRVYG